MHAGNNNWLVNKWRTKRFFCLFWHLNLPGRTFETTWMCHFQALPQIWDRLTLRDHIPEKWKLIFVIWFVRHQNHYLSPSHVFLVVRYQQLISSLISFLAPSKFCILQAVFWCGNHSAMKWPCCKMCDFYNGNIVTRIILWLDVWILANTDWPLQKSNAFCTKLLKSSNKNSNFADFEFSRKVLCVAVGTEAHSLFSIL